MSSQTNVSFIDTTTSTERTVPRPHDGSWEPGDACPECGNNVMGLTILSGDISSVERGLVQNEGETGRVEIMCSECESTLRQHPMMTVFDELPRDHWDGFTGDGHIEVTFGTEHVEGGHVAHDAWSNGNRCPECGEPTFFQKHLDVVYGTFDGDGVFHKQSYGDRLATLHSECNECGTVVGRHALLDIFDEIDTDL